MDEVREKFTYEAVLHAVRHPPLGCFCNFWLQSLGPREGNWDRRCYLSCSPRGTQSDPVCRVRRNAWLWLWISQHTGPGRSDAGHRRRLLPGAPRGHCSHTRRWLYSSLHRRLWQVPSTFSAPRGSKMLPQILGFMSGAAECLRRCSQM